MSFLQLLIASVLSNVTANILLKKGVIAFGGISGDKSKLLTEVTKAAFNPFIIVGLSLYGFSFLIWLRVLSFNDLTKAYPIFVSAVFVLTTIASTRLLDESVSLTRIIGMAIVLVGIFIIARS